MVVEFEVDFICVCMCEGMVIVKVVGKFCGKKFKFFVLQEKYLVVLYCVGMYIMSEIVEFFGVVCLIVY